MRRATAALLLVVLAACAPASTGGDVGRDQGTPGAPSSTPMATATSALTPAASATPASAATARMLSAAEISQVQSILTASLKHYQDAFAAGRKALGTTQYVDAVAGIAAMDEPTSSAARFRDWRTSSQIDQDISYLDAFDQAEALYAPGSGPAALQDWQNDMGDLTGDIGQWVALAVSWQINQVSDADLVDAAKAVTDAFALVQADVSAVVAQSS
jgi:hypothetical protein